MLAEMLVSTIAAQCMLWQTSPAATEVETVMVDWLRQALGLADGYVGVIQDSASSATLSAVLTMRERATGYTGNRDGLADKGTCGYIVPIRYILRLIAPVGLRV
jgi:aromatic-L-amino-acid decarboxylase